MYLSMGLVLFATLTMCQLTGVDRCKEECPMGCIVRENGDCDLQKQLRYLQTNVDN
jgi:hypothetical protein